jgi:hypothetical protein
MISKSVKRKRRVHRRVYAQIRTLVVLFGRSKGRDTFGVYTPRDLGLSQRFFDWHWVLSREEQVLEFSKRTNALWKIHHAHFGLDKLFFKLGGVTVDELLADPDFKEIMKQTSPPPGGKFPLGSKGVMY